MHYNTLLDLMRQNKLGYGNTIQVMAINMISSWIQVSEVIPDRTDQNFWKNNVSLHTFVTFAGEPIRFRVTAESFVETSPSGPETPDIVTVSEAPAEEPKVPYMLTVCIGYYDISPYRCIQIGYNWLPGSFLRSKVVRA